MIDRDESRFQGSALYLEILLNRMGASGLIAQASLTRAEAVRMRAEPSIYILNSQFGLLQYEVKAELPLRPSTRHWSDQTSLRIVQSDYRTDTMRLSLLESRPNSWTDGLRRLSPFKALHEGNESLFPNSGPTRYYLVNRDRGNTASFRTEQNPSVRIGTVEIDRRVLQFNRPSDWHAEEAHWAPQFGWFDQATLAKITVSEVARFTRGLKVDHFEVQP